MGDQKLMNELKDEQGRREDSAIDYGCVDAVWGDDMFTGINDTNIPEGPTARRIQNSARTAERFNIHVNPLVAAASGLLAQVARLPVADEVGDIHFLNVQLSDQVKLFEAEARKRAIDNDQLLAARYVLCTVVDEAVLNTSWGSKSDWSKISLLSRFHKETFGGEKFFQLLERLSTNPFKHLPMLELMYLCLALGFEGKYRSTRRNGSELEDVRDGLYRQIRHLRGDVSRTLSPHWQGAESPRNGPLRIVPMWLIVLFTFTSLTVLYSGFAWVLSEQREAVLTPYRSALSTVPEPRS
ncbi:type IVB secretion system protein IcmH/DotU [Pseudomonas syringae]|uniref:type IVB secretion system protein IcmH/DotU n=1 Tax=Pseudomonas syringae TaxID=317 RepID=UPI0013726762|nr:type IVB secretion system protein IcmH/DotU [Pseudomonas syringae]